MYAFRRSDFIKVVDDPIFLEFIQVLLDETFNLDNRASLFFRGDPQLLIDIKSVPREQYGEYLENYPLPYLSPIEDPEYYRREYGDDYYSLPLMEEAAEIRKELISRAVDRYEPSWWSYVHVCQSVAPFLLWPLVKLLYPDLQIFIYAGCFHEVIVAAPKGWTPEEILEYLKEVSKLSFGDSLTRDMSHPVIFDIIGYELRSPPAWIFEKGGIVFDPFDPQNLISEDEIISNYIQRFATYVGVDRNKFFRLESLLTEEHL